MAVAARRRAWLSQSPDYQPARLFYLARSGRLARATASDCLSLATPIPDSHPVSASYQSALRVLLLLFHGAIMQRTRLPNRRLNETLSFECKRLTYTATISRFQDGRIAEVFLTNHKAGSAADI